MTKGLRGVGSNLPPGTERIGLPVRPFLYTLDQISVILDMDEKTLIRSYLYLEGRSIGSRKREMMVARNIAPPADKPDWRVAERELVRWLRFKGFRYYDRGAITN